MWLSEWGGKNPKSAWWNDKVKAAVRRKKVLGVGEVKERFMETYREEKEC